MSGAGSAARTPFPAAAGGEKYTRRCSLCNIMTKPHPQLF